MRPTLFVIALSLAGVADGHGQSQTLQIRFVPAADSVAQATEEYRGIWAAEGASIVAVMERVTGLRFEIGPIEALIFEGVSYSGHQQVPMRLRASYPRAMKQATLVHELAHRLIGDLVPKSVEDHPIIFLFVYDVWTELWGKQFADEQVLVESRRRGRYDYATAWRDALAWPREERSRRLHAFIDAHRGS